MISAKQTFDSFVPISMFNRGKASNIFDRLHEVRQLFVLKNNKPEAVIISPAEFARLSEIEEDYILLSEAVTRESHSNGTSYSESDVLKFAGISEEELAMAEEPDIE